MKYKHDDNNPDISLGLIDKNGKHGRDMVNECLNEISDKHGKTHISRAVEGLEKLAKKNPEVLRFLIYQALMSTTHDKDSVPRHVVEKLLSEAYGLEDGQIIGLLREDELDPETIKSKMKKLICERCDNQDNCDNCKIILADKDDLDKPKITH